MRIVRGFVERGEDVRVVPLKCVGIHRWQVFGIPLASGDVVNRADTKSGIHNFVLAIK